MISGGDTSLDRYLRTFMKNKKKTLHCARMLFVESHEAVFSFQVNVEMTCCKFFFGCIVLNMAKSNGSWSEVTFMSELLSLIYYRTDSIREFYWISFFRPAKYFKMFSIRDKMIRLILI